MASRLGKDDGGGNDAKVRREWLTLMQLFDGLQADSFAGSYDAVRRFAGR